MFEGLKISRRNSEVRICNTRELLTSVGARETKDGDGVNGDEDAVGLRTQKGRAVQPEQEPFRSSPSGREYTHTNGGRQCLPLAKPLAEESGKLDLQGLVFLQNQVKLRKGKE